MGVNGLWKILNNSAKQIDLSALNNSILAIDTSIWLVRFIKSTAGRRRDKRAFLKLVWMRICTLLHYGIRPVFVFDGRTPEIKKKTIAKRKKLIKSSSKRYQKTLENVILSQFGLTSLEQLKDMIKNKENIHNFNSIDEHDDELIHLLCNEIESDDEVNIEEEIDYEIDSEEFLMLDEESKLSSLHKAKKHQKKVSKEMIATEFASDHSPDQYSKVQVQNFLKSSVLSKKIDETIQNVNQMRMKQSLSSPTTRYMLQKVEKSESDIVKEETITMIRRRDIFNFSFDENDETSFKINESHEDDNVKNESELGMSHKFDSPDHVDSIDINIDEKEHKITKESDNGPSEKEVFEEVPDGSFSDIEFDEEVFSNSVEEKNDNEDLEVKDNIVNNKEPTETVQDVIDLDIESETNHVINLDEEDIQIEKKGQINISKEENIEYDNTLIERIEQIEKSLQSNITNSDKELQILAKRSAEVDIEYIEDFKKVLNLFGIPYIESLGEADAQCAYLNMIGAVDGIISDDSDIFLFGGRTLIKNAFNKKSNPSLFWMESIEHNLGFSRHDLIFLALLLGSDYTEGIKGIGILSAMDIVSHFKGENSLNQFVDWINGEYEINDENFEKKYAKFKSKPSLFKGWPNKLVIDSYLNPPVKNSDTIEWKEFDLIGLKELGKFIGWSDEHIDTQLKSLNVKYESILRHKNNNNQEIELDRIKKKLNDIPSFSTPKRKKNTNILLPSKKLKTV